MLSVEWNVYTNMTFLTLVYTNVFEIKPPSAEIKIIIKWILLLDFPSIKKGMTSGLLHNRGFVSLITVLVKSVQH